VLSQIKKVRDRFDCQKVTFVGDRGMLKSTPLEDLKEADFAYITAITKPQIETLIKQEYYSMASLTQVCVKLIAKEYATSFAAIQHGLKK